MKDLREWLEACEKEEELKRIKAEVDWDLELGHVATLNERRGGPALLFEKVKDYDIPVLTSTITTSKRLAITCGRPPSYSMCDLARDWMKIMTEEKLIKPVEVKSNIPVMEEVIEEKDVNLFDFPSPRLYPQDGGRYLGLAFNFVTQDPETGWTNLGVYRGQLFDEKTIGANMFVRSKHGRMHMEKFAKKGSKMPAAAYCGCDMIHFVAGATMVPEQVDEYDVIGGLMGKPVEVFTSDLTGLKLPAHAEIILEGEIELDPAKFRTEGPLGEYVGFYAASGWGEPKPWFQVKRILRRKNPIFVATTVGRPVGDTHIANTIGRTAYLWADLEMMKVPGIQSVYCPPEATGRFWAIVSVKSTYPAQGERVAEAVCASPTGHFGVKGVIVVDADVPADDMAGVWWSLAVRYNPIEDTQIIKKMRATPFDPALPVGNKAIGSRILIDATTPVEWEKKPLLVELDEDTTKKVVGKWQEYGFEHPY
ncbi:MAG: phenylphosphate carboxylase subunit beta [Dehalococcoidia bacterium]|nr:phenylphosphate carboxylase subunit beta [Dehalococcoidia bacterium]